MIKNLPTIIESLFGFLIILTPLVFYPSSFELFEFNKMILVYFFTVIITALWLLRIVVSKQLIFKKTFFDKFLILFLISQIVSTLFSIDSHTSIFGYYSRFNGGLLSTICYLLLYWAFVSNVINLKFILNCLLFSAFLVSLWAAPSYFGFDPSCYVLIKSFTDNCWSADFNPAVRIFGTLGQPNWLAAFLAMIIPLNLTFLLSSKNLKEKALHAVLFSLNFLAFTLTYARGSTFGLISGLVLFFSLLVVLNSQPVSKTNLFQKLRLGLKLLFKRQKVIFIPFIIIILITTLFGSALSRRPVATTSNQLENEGTDSGKIRLVVWRGAWEIFKAYPLVGSGVETFAYSYHQFRPTAHNQVSEWEFLYNKAHNEYLNYLATTGLFGLFSYLILTIAFYFYQHRRFFDNKFREEPKLIAIGFSAGLTTYLVQNIVQFSVVPISLLFILFFAFSIVLFETDSYEPKFLKLKYLPTTALILLITSLTFFFAIKIYNYWDADRNFRLGLSYQGHDNNISDSYLDLAITEFDEPLYRSQLALTRALLFSEIEVGHAKARNDLVQSSTAELSKALSVSPDNLNLWKNAVKTYQQLAKLDPKYMEEAIKASEKTTKLAPTEPRVSLTYARLLLENGELEKSEKELERTIALKPDYYEALKELGKLYLDKNETQKARPLFDRVLKDYPKDIESLDALKKM